MGQPETATKHYEAARNLLEKRLREAPEDHRVHGSMGVAYAGLGRKEDAIREGKLGLSFLKGNRGLESGERIKEMAAIYLMVGEYDLAIDQLEELLSRPSLYSVNLLRIDPTWRELRPHPGFQSLLERHEGDGITS
jgi:serine/threonine-protein kinase